MVTLCGGAATTRSPRPRMEMLATQCPRLRRLSGRAAAFSFGIRMVGGLRPPSPGLHPPGDDPRTTRCGLRPQGGAWSLLTPYVSYDARRLPRPSHLPRPQISRAIRISRTPYVFRTPYVSSAVGGGLGGRGFWRDRRHRGRWGRPATRKALGDAGGRVSLNQSFPRGTCCWSRGVQRPLRPCRPQRPRSPPAWQAEPACYYVRT